MKKNTHVPDDYREVFTGNEEYTRQFAIIFRKRKEVIYQNPDLMEKTHGLPNLKPGRYLKKHHPERLPEYENMKRHNEGMMQRWLKLL